MVEAEIDQVARGQKAMVQVDAISQDWMEGQVMGVSKEVSSTGRTGTVLIKLLRGGDYQLRPGLSARCKIVTFDEESLKIPLNAYDKEEGGVVVVLSDGHPAFRSVTLGRTTREFYQVLNGLESGEKIIKDLLATPVSGHEDH